MSNDREKTEVLFLSLLFHLEDSAERKEREGGSTRGRGGHRRAILSKKYSAILFSPSCYPFGTLQKSE